MSFRQHRRPASILVDNNTTTLADYEYKGLYLNRRGLGGILDDEEMSDAVRLSFQDSTALDGYDAWGRPVWMRHSSVGGDTDLVKLAYRYSPGSDRLYQQDLATTTNSELYGYDSLHRLTNFKRGTLSLGPPPSISSPSRRQDWDDYSSTQLDDVGNWVNFNNDGTTETRTHNTANEITEIDPGTEFAPIYDDAGNLRILPDGAGNAQKFVHDYRSRLIEIWETADYDPEDPESGWGANPVVRYSYDGLNRRVKKDLNSGTDTIYLYDGWQCIEEREMPSTTWVARRQYVYGGTYIDEPLIFDRYFTEYSMWLRFYYCQQANYNVVEMADFTGSSFDDVQYDPYGQPTVTGSGSGNPLLFQGQYWDADANLYYFRNRWYSPSLGRFLQRDPMGYVGRMNLYQFTASQPLMGLDPYGLFSPGEHERLTKGSFDDWTEERDVSESCRKRMLKTLTDSNVSVDLSGFLWLKAVWKFISNTDTERHHTRHKNQTYDDASQVYNNLLANEIKPFETGLADVKDVCDTKAEWEHCLKALRGLGRASHLWQDFYGHSVLRDDLPEGGDKTIYLGPGSPGNPDPAWGPASYPGEHPWLGEPLKGSEKEARLNEASVFVNTKFDDMLTRWLAKCACCCGK